MCANFREQEIKRHRVSLILFFSKRWAVSCLLHFPFPHLTSGHMTALEALSLSMYQLRTEPLILTTVTMHTE